LLFSSAFLHEVPLTPHDGVAPFCSNPDCVLYIRAGDPGVVGYGNWAELSGGILMGRGIYHGLYLCDLCGRTLQPVPAMLGRHSGGRDA
jgi:hypothetical protein